MMIIDIREKFEYKEIPPLENTLLLPVSEFEDWIKTLDKNEEYKLICHTNNRSSAIAKMMRDNYGFDSVTHFEKGMATVTGEDDCETCNILRLIKKQGEINE